MKNYIVLFIGLVMFPIYAQMGINTNTPYKSAAVDINVTDKGLLITRVDLQSIFDVSTIPNPKKGMIVIATNDRGTSGNTIVSGQLYKFNGLFWDLMIDEENAETEDLLPKLVAYGVKNSQNTSLEGVTRKDFLLESTQSFNSNVVLNPNGSITVSKKGFYTWSIRLMLYAQPSTGSNYVTVYPGNIHYALRILPSAGETRTWHPFSLTGVVYLEENQTSDVFSFEFSEPRVLGDLVGVQSVLWQYISE